MPHSVVGPQTKAGQIGCDARHMKSDGFEWRIAPRLIVGWVNAEIVATHQLIIRLIEDAILPRQITRHKDEFHALVQSVVHAQKVHHAQHAIACSIVQAMGANGIIQRGVKGLAAAQTRLQIFARTSHPARHFDKSNHLLW